ncbi:hypothetical protein BGX38DRAFT_1274312 [Terfezia claveryi]|nr:hypothetical protein BGX38DRAFT_1274312 [Terfezia claveryi]
MKVTSQNGISIYTISGANTSRSLPDWLIRKRRKSLKSDVEFQNRIELVQDFEFEEASQCIRVSEDGEYAMATGTYKPQHHTYHLPSLALKYARHHISLNLTFLLLSHDYTKSVHLQTDRTIEFHTPMGCHYSIRIPRYGRALGYQKQRAEVVVPADGNEVYRLDLEAGRFLKPFELEEEVKSGESIGIESNCHGLLAFGTNKGTVEVDMSRIGFAGDVFADHTSETNPAITALEFAMNGLTLATGNAVGITTLFDIRSPRPLLIKDQQYGFPIHSLKFLKIHGSEGDSGRKVLSSDKKIIKFWDQDTGKPWTSIEPAVDLNHIEPILETGMIFTANEGQEMHSFFIPQLGPAPKWCSFLDNLTEEMADAHINDPDAYKRTDELGSGAASAYDNYKFLTKAELESFGLDSLVGTPKGMGVLRPYMHGYFISQKLWEEVRVARDPFEWERERQAMIRERIEKERESRIRSSKKDLAIPKVKVNKALAERIVRQEEKLVKRRERGRKDAEEKGKVVPVEEVEVENEDGEAVVGKFSSLLKDKRFGSLFEDPDFAIDENTIEYQQLHPAQAAKNAATSSSTNPAERKRDRTAAESEEDTSSNDNSDSATSDSDASEPRHRTTKEKPAPEMRISTANYRKSGHSSRGFDPAKNPKKQRSTKEKTFGARTSQHRPSTTTIIGRGSRGGEVLGDRDITFVPERPKKAARFGGDGGAVGAGSGNGNGKARRNMSTGGERAGRRSASGNAFRRMGVK